MVSASRAEGPGQLPSGSSPAGAEEFSADSSRAWETSSPSRPISLPAGLWKTRSPNSGITASTWSKTSD